MIKKALVLAMVVGIFAAFGCGSKDDSLRLPLQLRLVRLARPAQRPLVQRVRLVRPARPLAAQRPAVVDRLFNEERGLRSG